jgi:hypothetical protein
VPACQTPSKRGLSEVRGGDLSWFCGLVWRVTGAAPAAVERRRAAWWRFFSDAESSAGASLYNSLLILSLVGSIATTFLETTSTPGNFPSSLTSTGSARRYREYEIACTAIFSLDLLFRLLASERFLADRAPAARAAHQKRASYERRFSSLRSEKAKPFASDWRNWAVWIPNLQPDFNVRVIERFGPDSFAVLRELDESNRFVQKSAESTSI